MLFKYQLDRSKATFPLKFPYVFCLMWLTNQLLRTDSGQMMRVGLGPFDEVPAPRPRVLGPFWDDFTGRTIAALLVDEVEGIMVGDGFGNRFTVDNCGRFGSCRISGKRKHVSFHLNIWLNGIFFLSFAWLEKRGLWISLLSSVKSILTKTLSL